MTCVRWQGTKRNDEAAALTHETLGKPDAARRLPQDRRPTQTLATRPTMNNEPAARGVATSLELTQAWLLLHDGGATFNV